LHHQSQVSKGGKESPNLQDIEQESPSDDSADDDYDCPADEVQGMETPISLNKENVQLSITVPRQKALCDSQDETNGWRKKRAKNA
jgi:hypothetical protein